MSARIIPFPTWDTPEPPVDRAATLEAVARAFYLSLIAQALGDSFADQLTALYAVTSAEEAEALLAALEGRGAPS